LSDLQKKTAEKVEVLAKELEDEVCPDEVYQSHSRNMISVETQTLECGVAHTAVSKSVFDYYTLRYDDDDDDS
jgi:ferredoxin-like protein FixX